MTPTADPSTDPVDEQPLLWRALPLLSLLALVFFVSFRIDRSLWLDEAYSVNLASESFGGILEGLKRDGHPPLYFLLLAGWIRIFGDSEIAVRGLSGLCYLGAVFGVYALARTVLRRRHAAWVCAVLYLASKTAVAHAQNARMYALLGCLVALSTLFFYRSFMRSDPPPSKRRIGGDEIGYVVCLLLGTFTHFWFCFTVLAQGVAWLIFARGRRFGVYVLATAVALLPFTVLWLPIFFEHQIHNGVADWLGERSFGLGTLAATLADYYGEGALGALAWLGILLLLLIRLRDGRPVLPDRRRLAALGEALRSRPVTLFATLAAVSLLAPLLVSQFRPIYRIGSYTLIALPPLVIVLGALLHRFADRRALALFLIGLLGGAMVVFGWLRTRPLECSDEIATAHLLASARDGDRIVFTSLSRAAIDYYLRRQAPERNLPRFSFPLEIDEHPGWRSPPDQRARRTELDDEAARIDRRLRREVEAGERVWVFYGADTGISKLLVNRLQEWLELSEERECRSGFYNTIRLYQKPLAGETS